jgi:acetolactate synthase I/II/III large subunit
MTAPAPETTVADVVAHCLAEAGIRRVYGVPGEHCLTLVDAIGRRPDIEFISVRHESHAAFMAEAEAKLTGVPGACLGSASVGVANLLAGVNVAQHDSTPMLVLAGQVSTAIRGRDAWQELDLVRLLDTVCRAAVEIDNADSSAEMMRRAINLAQAGRPGPVSVVVPEDVQTQPSPAPLTRKPIPLARPTLDGPTAARIAELLAEAQRPVAIAGGGVIRSQARDALVTLAERAEIPVATGFRRPEAFPDDHSNSLGALGLGADADTVRALTEADLVLAVGTRLSELTTQRYRLPTPRQRLVHLDVDPAVLARFHLPAEVGACVDAREALLAIIDRLGRHRIDRPRWWTSGTQSDTTGPREGQPGERVPLATQFCAVLNALLPEDGVVTSDAGDFYIPLVQTLRYGRTRRYLGPTSGTMGYGLPAAIAAKIADPDRAVVACCGDGGFMMSVAELGTIARLDLPGLVVAILTNDSYGSIRRHQRDRYAGRYLGVDLVNPEISHLARAFGLHCARIEPDTDIKHVLSTALTADTATLVEVPIG